MSHLSYEEAKGDYAAKQKTAGSFNNSLFSPTSTDDNQSTFLNKLAVKSPQQVQFNNLRQQQRTVTNANAIQISLGGQTNNVTRNQAQKVSVTVPEAQQQNTVDTVPSTSKPRKNQLYGITTDKRTAIGNKNQSQPTQNANGMSSPMQAHNKRVIKMQQDIDSGGNHTDIRCTSDEQNTMMEDFEFDEVH